jgi:hypothetical protein
VESIRVSLIKPEGTLSIVCQSSSSAGIHYPIIKQGCRDISFDRNNIILKLLVAGGYTHFQDPRNPNTYHVKFPFKIESKSSKEISIWKKFALCEAVQRNFCDNSTSFTGDFHNLNEGEDIKDVITFSISKLKSLSAFPQIEPPSKEKTGFYSSMSDKAFEKLRAQYKFLPFEELNNEDYEKIASKVTNVDWNQIYDPNAVCKFDASKLGTSGCTSCVGEDVYE